MWPAIRYDHDAPVSFGGQGGEIFRGYLYPKEGAGRMSLAEDDAGVHSGSEAAEENGPRAVERPHPGGHICWPDSTRQFRAFETFPVTPLMSLDMLLPIRAFCSMEPCCVSAAPRASLRSILKAARSSRWPTGCQLQFERFPAGFRKQSSRRWLPRAYWWRINGDRILQLKGVPGVKGLLRLRRVTTAAWERVRGKRENRP